MKAMTLVTFLAASLLLVACDNDVSKGKSRAIVSEPVAALKAETQTTKKTPETTLTIDKTNSAIAAVGAKVTGKHDIVFDEWSGELSLAGDRLTGIEVMIDMNSIRADQPKLTGHLKSPDFFDVAKFPTATFRSTKIVESAGGYAGHEITGDLTMHGVTKTVTFPARVERKGDRVSANAEFVIDRGDFGIVYPGMPDDLIKDEVALNISLTAAQPGA